MSYEVELSDEAVDDLRAMSVDLRMHVINQLETLRANPVGLSRRVAFPYRPIGQMYQFWAADRIFVTIFFQYRSDETTIEILAVGKVEYGPPLDGGA